MSTTPPLLPNDSKTIPQLVPPAPFSRQFWLDNIGLAILPLLFLILSALFLHAKGPYWLGTSADPDYPYLFNALLMDQGEPPQHTDHPGTPVQLWLAVVLKITHAVAGHDTFVKDVLRRPEYYLAIGNWTMLAAVATSMWVAGSAVWVLTRSRTATILIQATPLLCPTTFYATLCVKPEPLLVAGILLFIASTAHAVHRQTLARNRVAVLFGILSGTLLAMKISTAPILILPLILLRGWRSRAAWILVSVATFVLFLIPIFSKLHDTAHFVWAIMTHQNAYGLGAPGIDISDNFQWFFHFLGKEPLFLAVLVTNIFLLILHWRKRPHLGDPRRQLLIRLLLAVSLIQIATVIEFFRHPYADRYLVPALMLVGLSGALYLMLLPAKGNAAQKPAGLLPSAAIATAFLLSAAIGNILLFAKLNSERKFQTAMLHTLRTYPGHPPILTSYHASSPLFALYFGNTFSRYTFAPVLNELYPHTLFANRSTNSFEGFDGRPQPLDVGVALLQGLPCSPEIVFAGGYHVAPIQITADESTYVLVRRDTPESIHK